MPGLQPIRKRVCSIIWNHILARPPALCDQTMKLMGKHLLHQLATAGAGGDAGAIGALCAELEAAAWADAAAARRSFPNARRDGHRVEITMACGVRVCLAVNYVAGVALVESARWTKP